MPVPDALGQSHRDLIRQSLLQLGSTADPSTAQRLTSGRSGALVVALEQDRRRVVLKLTLDRSRQDRAARELRLVSTPELQEQRFSPTFLGGHHGREAVSLLTEWCEPCPPAARLSASDWRALASRLGVLHRMPIPGAACLTRRTWPGDQAVAQACVAWDDVGRGALARRAAVLLVERRPDVAEIGDVLTHGDCHVENLVRDAAGTTRWIDWSEAAVGDGSDDLVFLWQRAEFDGADPPRESMLEAYCRARGVDGAAFRRAAVRAELRLLVTEWPFFLGYGTAERQQRLIDRLAELVEQGGSVS